jgi:hypothetical protein
MRPGWAAALAMAHSSLPYERLLSIDERLEHAAARPVIVPDTIVIDHGSVFVSDNFRSSCRHLGISLQPAHLATGSDKPHIERMFSSLGTMFCQFATGYLGRSTDRRGRHVEQRPLWSMLELQDLLDEWLISVWQNREHDGLRDPVHPQRAFSPNDKYAALIEAAGYVPVPLGPGDYIELLPAIWRAINAYGIKISHRTYDSPELNPIRLQKSATATRNGLWEIHHDPYDVSRVFARGPAGWITCTWKYLDRVPLPFGELAWDHVSGQLARQGRQAGELERAAAVDELLRRAYHGPPEQAGNKASEARKTLTARDRRVAARTTAAASGSTGTGAPPAAVHEEASDAAGTAGADDVPAAPVIPMPIFDPFAEADKPW